jgi:hypothetical protein
MRAFTATHGSRGIFAIFDSPATQGRMPRSARHIQNWNWWNASGKAGHAAGSGLRGPTRRRSGAKGGEKEKLQSPVIS